MTAPDSMFTLLKDPDAYERLYVPSGTSVNDKVMDPSEPPKVDGLATLTRFISGIGVIVTVAVAALPVPKHPFESVTLVMV